MRKKKRQHFVPRFYFRYFSADNARIHLLVRDTGRVVKHVSIREQCADSYFYGPQELEERLEAMERIHIAGLDKCRSISSLDQLSPENQRFIREAVLVQKARTRAERERHRPSQDKLVRMFFEAKIGKDSCLTEAQRNGLLGNLDNVSANPRNYQWANISTASQAAMLIEDLSLYVLENRTQRPFIFGDAPVVLYNYWGHKVQNRSMLGLQIPGLQLFFPLGPRRCLMVIDDEKYDGPHKHKTAIHGLRNDADVDHLNKLQIHNAHETVYFGDGQDKGYVERLHLEERTILRNNVDPIEPVFIHDRQNRVPQLGTHTYQTSLPYILNLSFLECSPVEESDYHPELRKPEIAKSFLNPNTVNNLPTC